jgi:hypothetical protein
VSKAKTTKPYVYKRRLLKLAAFLEKLPRERFDFSLWVGRDWGGAQDLSCGTTACAMGFGVAMFGKQCRVRLVRVNAPLGDNGCWPVCQWRRPNHNKTMAQSAEAGARIFGVTELEFIRLFTSLPVARPTYERLPSNATAKQVAKHIRTFVAEKYGAPS